jgi:hypothetical protein
VRQRRRVLRVTDYVAYPDSGALTDDLRFEVREKADALTAAMSYPRIDRRSGYSAG